MICHVVLYRMKAESTEGDEAWLIDEARRRLPLLPGVKNLRAGKNIELAPNGYSLALVMDFEEAAALEAYRVHSTISSLQNKLPGHW
jgi:hypothetical protein